MNLINIRNNNVNFHTSTKHHVKINLRNFEKNIE